MVHSIDDVAPLRLVHLEEGSKMLLVHPTALRSISKTLSSGLRIASRVIACSNTYVVCLAARAASRADWREVVRAVLRIAGGATGEEHAVVVGACFEGLWMQECHGQ
jgi:hypothetical protein